MSHSYAEDIEKAVFKWLDSNKDQVMSIIQDAIKEAVGQAVTTAIDMTAAAMVTSVKKFLDENKQDISTGIAASCAMEWNKMQVARHGDDGIRY